MSDLDLDAMEARANAATPGPWHGSHEDYGQCVHVGDYGYVCSGPNTPDYDGGVGEQGRDDAEFIAHAREDVPVLVAEVRALRAEVVALRRTIHYCSGSCRVPDSRREAAS